MSNRNREPSPVDTITFKAPSLTATGDGALGNLQQIQEILNSCLPQLSRLQLIALQEGCKTISKIKKNIKYPWKIVKGILFKTVDSSYRLAWPAESTVDLLTILHRQNSIYHLRKNKLQKKVSKFFHIFKYSTYYDAMISKCSYCQLMTRARINHKLPMGASVNVYNAADAWYIDFLIVDSTFTNNAILLCVCVATNYIVPICLSDKSKSQDIVTALCTHLVQPYGQFLCLGSDGQSTLTSELLAEICAVMRVRRFIVSRPQQNHAERAHRFILWMMGAIKRDIGVKDSLMPIYLAHCALLYNNSVKTNENITPFFLMNGFRSPHLSKLIPFTGYLSNRPNTDTRSYVKAFVKMREAMYLINFKRRQLHLERLGLQKNFQENLRIGDLVLITRSSPRGARAGHKLRPVNHTSVFKICKLYHRSAIVLKYNKEMVFRKLFKQRGGNHKVEYISVNRDLIKPLKNTGAHFGFTISDKLWVKIVQILDQKSPPNTPVCLLSVDETRAVEGEMNKFFLKFDESPAFFNDLRADYKENLIANRMLLLEYKNRGHRRESSLDKGQDENRLLCYSAGRVIFPKSSINFSQITCSYGRSLSCLEQRRDFDTTTVHLKKLQAGNIPSHLGQMGQMTKKKKQVRKPISTLSYVTQSRILEDFIQSLDPTSPSTNMSSDTSVVAEEQLRSFDHQIENGQNELTEESNQTGSFNTTLHPGTIDRSSRSSRTVAEICSTTDHSYHSDESTNSSVTLIDHQSLHGSVRPANLLESTAGAMPILDQVRDTDQLLDLGDEPPVNIDSGLVTQNQPSVSSRKPVPTEPSHQLVPTHSPTCSQPLLPGQAHEGRTAHTIATGSKHWNFPSRKRSPSTHVAPDNPELVLSVIFDGSPGTVLEPLSRGHDRTSVPTVLANRSIRGAKTNKLRRTNK